MSAFPATDGDPPGLGGVVRASRVAAGLSQPQLAAAAGVSVGALRDLEQGRTRRPRAELLRPLAAALGVDLAQVSTTATRFGGGRAPAPRRAGLWLRMLGPLSGWRDDAPLVLGSPRQRAVLGLLVLHAGSRVHRNELIDGVWGQNPPAAAVNLVQAHVGRLRRALDAGRSPRDPGGVLVSTGRCYELRVGRDELDWWLFQDLATRGATAFTAGDVPAGCRHYEQALALWQGEPLADVESLRGSAAVAAVERAWAAVVGDFAHAATTAGVAERALPHLWALAGYDPLNENAHGLLMKALVATGQQAAALQVFSGVRDRLDTQLGIGPGAELSELYVRILRRELPSTSAAAAVVVPARQLPAAVPGFVGRTEELAALTALLEDGGGGPHRTAVISAIDGAGGIGKTALAVHWAHSVADRFPDGQLYVDLRGFDPASPPLSTAEAIRCFLDALQVPAERMPMGVDAQAALYRSLLADKRVLVVLDNAHDSAQARPLLPASPSCMAVVTSRRQLTSLAVAEGARRITVDLLNRTDARQLLASRLGSVRVAAEGEAVDELVALCAGLPLALSIAAARTAAHPHFPVAALVTQLRDTRYQLDALSGGEAASDLRRLFDSSYQDLSPATARLFRLLGLYAGPDLSVPVAASLAGIARQQAHRAVDELCAAHLLAERAPGRYLLHDLLRTYAAELAHRYDSDAERLAAEDRVFSHYLHSLHAADRLRYPTCRPILSSPSLPGVCPEEFADPDHALSWCQAERPVLAALIGQAAEAGPEVYSSGSRWCLWLFFHLWSHWHDLAEARRVVLTATRLVAADSVQPLEPSDSYDDVRYKYRRLVEVGRGRGERTAAAYCLFGLTQMLNRQRRYGAALAFAQHALDWFRTIGDQAGKALALSQIGRYQIRGGRPDLAAVSCQQALDLCRELGEWICAASAADSLGVAERHLGHYRKSADWCGQAATLYGEMGDRYGRIEALIHLGDAQHALGDDCAARVSWCEAEALLADPGHPNATLLRGKLGGLSPA